MARSEANCSGHIYDLDPVEIARTMGNGVTLARVGGAVLLAAAITGALWGAKAPQRWGRPGGAMLVGRLSVLLARDVTMITAGSLTRLRPLPAGLLVAETATAGTAIALGTGAWLTGYEHDPGSRTNPPGSRLATLTFTIHAVRQLIYLSPSQGRGLTSR